MYAVYLAPRQLVYVGSSYPERRGSQSSRAGVPQNLEGSSPSQGENPDVVGSGGSRFVDNPATCLTDLLPTVFLLPHTLPAVGPTMMSKEQLVYRAVPRGRYSCRCHVDADVVYLGNLK